MGTTLHYSTINFFEARMSGHSRVERCTRIAGVNEYLYTIERKGGLTSVNVFLSDAYRYGHADYVARPKQLKRYGFILIARPESSFDHTLIEQARLDGIGIGKIGKLMGALNSSNVCDY